MAQFKCKMCGGTIDLSGSETVGTCEYCGTQQTFPKLNDDRRANLYDRANHFRRNNEFDKAMGIYEQILNDDNTDAESYWSLVLCRYGIEYVEDPATHKRVPTVNRAQYTSIFDDDNYKSALEYADGYQRHIYQEEAKAINEIQKGILAISQKEEPFDVFICYKETDRNGRRTPDSVLANDLYHQLTQEGFKVFFSRITLEDKLGVAYEPYIFAALNSAKVMVVVGTKPEYFNAVWVKNEWSRYLSLIRGGAKKVLIPAYRDMDPYDLPEEFSHLQAQDMNKLGFMQDLIRGIKKLAQTEAPKQTVVKETVITSGNASTEPLLKRAFMFLEDGEWNSANEYCEKVLDIEPENAQAYLGKLMAELRVRKQDDLKDCSEPFDGTSNYKKAIRFADGELRAVLSGYVDHINERNEQARLEGIYVRAKGQMAQAQKEFEYQEVAQLFDTIAEYKDSATRALRCRQKAEDARKDEIYDGAMKLMTGNQIANYREAINHFETIQDWRDSREKIALCQQKIARIEGTAKRYKKISSIAAPIVCVIIVFVIVLNTVLIPNHKYDTAVALMESGNYGEAAIAFEELVDYKDSADLILECYYRSACLLKDTGRHAEAAIAFYNLSPYKDAKEQSMDLWNRIAERDTISAAAFHSVGLKADGTVVAVGDNDHGKCDVSAWTDIVAISADNHHTIGLKENGTIVATNPAFYRFSAGEWNDIVAISAGLSNAYGLKADGTVVVGGDNEYGQWNASDWTDIVAIRAGVYHIVGLKADGTVVAVGDNDYGQCDVSDWTDIVAVSAGSDHTIGLKSDGTVVYAGYVGDESKRTISSWTDIVAISAGRYHTVGLKADGTVVGAGSNHDGACNVSGWTDIVAISAGSDHTIGLKADGTVVATVYLGDYGDYGQCNVSGWKNIKLPD